MARCPQLQHPTVTGCQALRPHQVDPHDTTLSPWQFVWMATKPLHYVEPKAVEVGGGGAQA